MNSIAWKGNQIWEMMAVKGQYPLLCVERSVEDMALVPTWAGLGSMGFELAGLSVLMKASDDAAKTEVIVVQGSRKKVRRLVEVICSVQSPKEVLAAERRQRQGRGLGRSRRGRAVVVSAFWKALNLTLQIYLLRSRMFIIDRQRFCGKLKLWLVSVN